MYIDMWDEVCFMTSPDGMDFVGLNEPLNEEQMATVLIANNEIFLNGEDYIDCWDYNKSNEFYEDTWVNTLNLIKQNSIKTLNELLIDNRHLLCRLKDIIEN